MLTLLYFSYENAKSVTYHHHSKTTCFDVINLPLRIGKMPSTIPKQLVLPQRRPVEILY